MPRVYARQICEPALRLLGVAASDQPIEADMAEAALDGLNTMLDSWSTERLLVWTRPRYPLVLVPGRGAYTWGELAGELAPGDVSEVAPIRLEIALLNIAGSPEQEWPLHIMSQSEYEQGIWLKTFASDYPQAVYLEQTQGYRRLHVYPVPTRAYTLYVLPWEPHSPYTHWDAAMDWPSGYARAMQFNLAIELAPQYGVEPSPTVLRTAEESKRALYVPNVEVGRLSLRPGRRVVGGGLGYPQGFYTGRG